MNPYIQELKTQLREYQRQCGSEEETPVLDILWQCYLDSNLADDDRVRQAEAALDPIHQALPFKISNELTDLIMDISIAYQRAAFLEGIRIGISVQEELL